jgi:hypothetical protein
LVKVIVFTLQNKVLRQSTTILPFAMAASPRSLFCLLSLLLLASCTDPNAFRITGPSKQVGSGGPYGSLTQLDFTVYNMKASCDSCWQLLNSTALGAVNSEDKTGMFRVTFTDDSTKHVLFNRTLRVDPDLLFQNKQAVFVN